MGPRSSLAGCALWVSVACSGGGGVDSDGVASGGADSGGVDSGGGGPAGGGGTTSGGSSGSTSSGGDVGSGSAGSGSAGSGGEGGSGASGGAVGIDEDALFVAPDGAADASGTLGDPLDLPAALLEAQAGRTLYLRGGTYSLGATLSLSADGAAGQLVQLRAYPLDTERPLLDFSSMAEDSASRGLVLSGDYWHIFGLDVREAGDNCLFVSGSHSIIEHSTFARCADTGLQLGNGAADNLVVNCDSYFNADSTLENADGFAAKLDVGSGNRFVGCRAWNNLDDGWDGYLRPADHVTTTYDSCWAIDNGKGENGSVGAGDGNGFKTGGSDDKDLSHDAVYTRCIAAGNVSDGFDHNSNRGSVTILNSAAHDNGQNINFSATNVAASLTVKNTISLGTMGTLEATTTDITNNSWQVAFSATDGDFSSVDTSLLKSPRQSDGSLPEIDYLHLVPGSDLIDGGQEVGLGHSGTAPDLGPFESFE